MYADGTVPGEGRRGGNAVPAVAAPTTAVMPAVSVPTTAAVPAPAARTAAAVPLTPAGRTAAAVPLTPAGGIVADSVRRELRARIVVVAFSLVASTSLALILSLVLGTAG